MTVVVGQSERCASAESVRPLRFSSSLGLGFVVRFWLALAMGVGQVRVTSSKLGPPWAFCPRIPTRPRWPDDAVAVGQCFAAPVSRGPVRLLASSFASTPAVVGHFRAQESSESLPRVAYSSRPSPGSPLLPVPYLTADGVGYSPRDQEDPRAAVRGPDILCRNWDR